MTRTVDVASAVLLLAVVAVGWRMHRETLDDGGHERATAALVALRTSDVAFASALLESRSGIVNHFDAIVHHGKRRRYAVTMLRAALPHGDAHDELAREVEDLGAALTEQDELVERFKSHHAILRNSVRYLPLLARQLVDTLALHQEGSALAAELNALLGEVLLFHDFGERFRIPRVRARLAELDSEASPWLGPKGQSTLRLLRRHAAIILDEKVEVDTLLEAIGRTDVANRIALVHQLQRTLRDQAQRRTSDLEHILTALGLLLTLTIASSIIFRMAHSANELRMAKEELEGTMASLEDEKEKQKELAALKSHFVSMTSHEFRTPLSVILSSTELLDAYGERWTPEKRREHLARIQAAGQRMKQMLDEVLFIGRSDAGMLKFEPSAVDVRDLCRELVATLRLDSLTTHHIDSTWEGEEHTAMADERLLTHILSNLLSNAMKYSPDATSIRLDVERHRGELVLRVQDEGIGIPEADLDRLFDSFHRGSNVGHISGTGLGLAIVHRAVELHGGSIDVESVTGRGSTFTVTLPIEDVPSLATAKHHEARARAS